jgi:hypothetical protein
LPTAQPGDSAGELLCERLLHGTIMPRGIDSSRGTAAATGRPWPCPADPDGSSAVSSKR